MQHIFRDLTRSAAVLYQFLLFRCLLLQACAGQMQPKSTYRQPVGAAAVENSSLDTGQNVGILRDPVAYFRVFAKSLSVELVER